MRIGVLTRGLPLLAVAATMLLASATAAAVPLNPGLELGAMSCPSAGNCAAVGDYGNGVGQGEGVLFQQRGGRWGQGIQAALPANAGPDPLNQANNTGLSDVSCVSAGNCSAVGVYTDNSNSDRGLLLTEAHGRWARGVEARLPGNAYAPAKSTKTAADNLVLLADGCTSAGNCYAVGNYVTASDTIQGLIVTERDGHWQTGEAAPLPAGATVRGQKAVLYAIACLSSGACTATGSYVDANGNQQAMLLSETGGHWTASTEAGLPATAGTNPTATPIAIDCPDASDCAVVGNFENGNNNALGLLLSQTAGSLTPGTQATLPTDSAPPTSYNAQTTILPSVACAGAGNCAAVGSYTDQDGNAQALLLSESDGTWTTGQQVALPSNQNLGATEQTAGLDTVSCPATGDCVAGGEYTDTADNDDSLLVTETNGTWGPGVEIRLPGNAAGTQYSAVDSISCASVGNCTAVGSYSDAYGGTLGYSIKETGGVWGRASELEMPSADAAELQLALAEMLTPAGKDATVSAIHKAKGFKLEYVALEPLRVTVDWYSTTKKGRTLIAAGHTTATSASLGTVTLRLSAAGHKLFGAGRTVKLTAVATLTPRHGTALTASKVFTLK